MTDAIYAFATLARPFGDSFLWAHFCSYLAPNFPTFRSGPNQTSSNLTCPSLQFQTTLLGARDWPLQVPSCKTIDFSMLALAPVTSFYCVNISIANQVHNLVGRYTNGDVFGISSHAFPTSQFMRDTFQSLQLPQQWLQNQYIKKSSWGSSLANETQEAERLWQVTVHLYHKADVTVQSSEPRTADRKRLS